MRLRVNVIRHGLPDTPIVWAIDTISGPTIYQLLEQVNEVIPVESDGEWGLEDYIVELKSDAGFNYECLHFQLVTSVLKEDDEIIIRCLLSNELKKRKVSGRNQITSGGRRLFDGVPWGRQRLHQKTQRPTIKFLSRKPKSLIYNDSDDSQCSEEEEYDDNKKSPLGEISNQQLCLYESENDDSENDQDFDPESTDEESTDQERTDQESFEEKEEEDDDDDDDNEISDHHRAIDKENIPELVEEVSPSDRIEAETREIQSKLGNHVSPEISSGVHALHAAFPTSSLDVCKYVLDGTAGNVGEAWEALSLEFPARISRSATSKLNHEKDYPVPSPQLLSKPPKFKICKNMAKNSGKKVESECSDSLIDQYNCRRLPSGPQKSRKALSSITRVISPKTYPSNFLNSLNSNQTLGKKIIHFSAGGINKSHNLPPKSPRNSRRSEAGTSINVTSGDSDADVLTSKKLSRHTNNSDHLLPSSGLESQNTERKKRLLDRSDSDSSDASSSEDDAPEQASCRSKIESTVPVEPVQLKNPVIQTLVAPGKGKKATQRRNKRRRISNAKQRYEKKGILPAGTSIEKFKISGEKHTTSLEPTPEEMSEKKCVHQTSISAEVNNVSKLIEDVEFQRRRKRLLDSLATGGVEVCSFPPVHEPHSTSITIANSISGDKISTQSNDISLNLKKTNALGTDVPRASTTPIPPLLETPSCPGHSTNSDTPGKNVTISRRSKLDMAAGRRMLLSAMGLKPQKSTEKQKCHLANRKFTNLEKDIEEEIAEDLEMDDRAWREKITYRAVECVHEGIELSEPPFPFSQRWDPQQQGCKRKRNKSYQSKFCDENNRVSKKQKQRQATLAHTEEQNIEDMFELDGEREVILNNDLDHSTELSKLPPNEANDEVHKELQNDKNMDCKNDLVSLPENLPSLEDLKEGEAREGMIIAFKQLEVSAANRWQPQVSSYKTAIISSVVNDQIQIILARRDIPVSEKKYDEEGNRIYDGFDGIEDEDEEEDDDGARSLLFNELIEPKVVQQTDHSIEIVGTKSS
ncbi:hypothetical protein K3495_g1752 [Podosphaera aphanis]|nr:hypothetical protein K3495_g1752 [Podosphaera aphanis]